MTKNNYVETVFSDDEMRLLKVESDWSGEQLLEQEGVFYLKDVVKSLRISSTLLKQKAQKLTKEGGSPWKEMGIQRVWTHWMVRMSVFAPYYREHMVTVREVDPQWDGNQLLAQKGFFYLVDVCRLIPFTPSQIRYHAHRHSKPRETYGVWKDDYLNTFLVDMKIFSRWVKSLWLNGFQNKA